MSHYLKDEISYFDNVNSIIKLNKGFSHDEKYVINDHYLLRVFPNEELNKRKEEFETINKLGKYSNLIPKGLDFGFLEKNDRAYMLLTYLPGIDAEVALRDLTKKEQYSAGFLAGKELKKLHKLSAPLDHPSWFSLKKKKSDKYLMELKAMNLDKKLKELLESYIKHHENLMKDRPNKFQHDDFHPSNILINNRNFSGIIDFQRMDWGDPIHDLQKLGFFSKRVSIDFTRGIIDGYHENQKLDDSFWELYALYSAIHIVSALVWAMKKGQKQYELLLEYSLDVVRDHHQFRCIVPNWYKQKQ
ncbi:aminoglycoside phosphotransferase [Siminovitchia terrae]|uniref:Aminoglycoside phosphotransferase n=1 Tax=Siminovitchia terrae TaxID=1914933 RepID=A0A429X6L2_SIMTE|nr:aminoglycoside phosphotransferase family protein [Siminovitchia terrae]RST59002.1 aminoglycoside phosphotransferase family protein [Siminovitchia terrae]GIN96594.1 aminoglycoside phosphotransferase [Siminovitchia terrae]